MAYWPSLVATSRVLTDLAEYLAVQGNEVHVICTGSQIPQDPDAPLNQKSHNSVHIHRIPDLSFPKLGIVSWNHPANIIRFFFVAGILMLLWSYKFEIVVTPDFPPVMGIWGTLAQFITRGKTRHVCWIMDMIVDSRFQLGLWRSDRFHHRLIDYLHTLSLRYATLNIVLGNCMRERLLRRHIDASRVKVIGIWHYSNVVNPLPFGTSPQFFQSSLSYKFVAMYSGNAGSLQTFDAIQDAMLALRDDNRIQFVFVGNSDVIREVEAFASANNLSNFTRFDLVPWEDLNLLLAGGNVHLITLRDEMQGICVPSKLYGAMAAGRPIIFVGPHDSQTSQDVLESDAGFVVKTSDSQKLMSTIRYLADNPVECQRLGNNAHRSFLLNHDCSVRCHQWEETLKNL